MTSVEIAAKNVHRNPIDQLGEDEHTWLCRAAASGFESIVKAVLAEKADVNGRNSDGSTPLILAAQQAIIKLVTLLRDKWSRS